MNDEDTFTLAMFPVDRYLGDSVLQKSIMNLVSSRNVRPTDAQTLLPFHPLSLEALKQGADMDVYCLVGIYGRLVRTHVVTENGVALTNPPPKDYLRDSCHIKGWLKKDFQDSKIDGANIPVWLCPSCSKLKPEERDVRF
jgi:hypothetical protein